MSSLSLYGENPPGLDEQLSTALQWLEVEHNRNFDDPLNPLLVSVRSGAAVSMPGMMDTILNVGLNRKIVQGLARRHGSMRFALDSYRHLLQNVRRHSFGSSKDKIRSDHRSDQAARRCCG